MALSPPKDGIRLLGHRKSSSSIFRRFLFKLAEDRSLWVFIPIGRLPYENRNFDIAFLPYCPCRRPERRRSEVSRSSRPKGEWVGEKSPKVRFLWFLGVQKWLYPHNKVRPVFSLFKANFDESHHFRILSPPYIDPKQNLAKKNFGSRSSLPKTPEKADFSPI